MIKNQVLILLFLSLFFAQHVFGQAQTHHCGTMDYNEYLMSQNPEYAAIRKKENQRVVPNRQKLKSGTEKIIPVVVHVIWRTASQEISDAQIQSQIDVMNKDLTANNWDTIKVPGPFKSLIGKTDLKFMLANRDENGDRTSGITRTKTVVQDFANTTGDQHCKTSKGGQDPWDRDKYLNIWVCEISGGIYGFATFPGSPANCDGLVIDFDCFGTTGTAKSPTDKGRTVTHEFGHWLNLIHISGDAQCGNDLVADTPEQEEQNFGCLFFPHITCSNGPNGDMFMNYMDYSDDNCMYMFTHGQVSRMEDAITTFRPNLINSDGFNGIHSKVAKKYSIGPNPANQELIIQSDGTVDKIEIFNIGGTLIQTFNGRIGPNHTLSTSELVNGLYIINLASDQSAEYHKILIQH